MKEEHIINFLEENKFKDLSDADLRLIETHAGHCAECRREYEAAKVSSIVLKERAAQTLEPTPFFETRVMSAWRQQQAALKPVTSRIWEMWQDTKLLVSGLATSVALLLVLVFVSSQMTNDRELQASADDYYSVDSLVFDGQDSADDLTDEEMLQAIYETEDLEN